jgi:hypothetical protein
MTVSLSVTAVLSSQKWIVDLIVVGKGQERSSQGIWNQLSAGFTRGTSLYGINFLRF